MLNFKNIRAISWFWMVLSILIWPIIIMICFNFILPFAKQIAQTSNGIIQPTFIFSIILFIVVIVGIIFTLGKLKPGDIGLTTIDLPAGIFVPLGVWILLQLIIVIILAISGTAFVYSDDLSMDKLTSTLGIIIAQVFGNAFVEELMFRGFLMPQLYLSFGGRKEFVDWKILLAAIIVSQIVFALIHIPNLNRLTVPGGTVPVKLLVIFIMGMFFSLLYYRTGNIFICIGLHTLINTPMSIFQSVFQPAILVFVMAFLILFIWPLLNRRIIFRFFRL